MSMIPGGWKTNSFHLFESKMKKCLFARHDRSESRYAPKPCKRYISSSSGVHIREQKCFRRSEMVGGTTESLDTVGDVAEDTESLVEYCQRENNRIEFSN